MNRGLTLIGGPIEYLGSASVGRSPYELTPVQTRMLFDIKGWTKIVALHTRNVPHRGHEHILSHAVERSHADGVLVHAAVGQQKASEFSTEAILGAWEQLIRLAFPKALLAAFSTYSRFSGPREAVFTALCQRNFGCTHFVVGRDQSSVDGFYPPDATRELFESLGDIGITPVFFDTVYFSDDAGATVESSNKDDGLLEISGTQIRRLLASNVNVPTWCMRNELSGWLAEEHSAGMPLFATPE